MHLIWKSITVCLLLSFTISCSKKEKVGTDEGEISVMVMSDPQEPPAKGILIVTDASLSGAWNRFCQWKEKLGKPCYVVTTQEISEKYEGVDIQDEIRQCILSYSKEYNVQWAILGGDSSSEGGLVPDRDTIHTVYQSMYYKDIPSDAYYISEKSWDANEDGVFGEWAKDKSEMQYVNDQIYIGRVPVRTPDDVKNFTQKVIQYESNYKQGVSQKMVYTCTVPSAYPKLRTSTDVLEEVWDGKISHFFAHHTPWDKEKGGDFALSAENWVEVINTAKAGKMHIHGHGLLPVWQLEKHSDVSAETVAQLKNKDFPLCVTTVSCFTGQFDSEKDPCITESMLRHPDGGAVMVIAPAREGVPIFHNPREDMRKMVKEGKMDGTTTLLTSFWKHGLSKDITAGEAFHLAKKDMVKDAEKNSGYHWCLCEINFLGDPSLELRAFENSDLKE